MHFKIMEGRSLLDFHPSADHPCGRKVSGGWMVFMTETYISLDSFSELCLLLLFKLLTDQYEHFELFFTPCNFIPYNFKNCSFVSINCFI